MASVDLRKKIHALVDNIEEQKLQSLYTLVKDEINASDTQWDAAFINELENRSRSMQEENAVAHTWEETKQAAYKRLTSK